LLETFSFYFPLQMYCTKNKTKKRNLPPPLLPPFFSSSTFRISPVVEERRGEEGGEGRLGRGKRKKERERL
jgi:hypothetical protein